MHRPVSPEDAEVPGVWGSPLTTPGPACISGANGSRGSSLEKQGAATIERGQTMPRPQAGNHQALAPDARQPPQEASDAAVISQAAVWGSAVRSL